MTLMSMILYINCHAYFLKNYFALKQFIAAFEYLSKNLLLEFCGGVTSNFLIMLSFALSFQILDMFRHSAVRCCI